MTFKWIGISASLILLVIFTPVGGRTDALSEEDAVESCSLMDEAPPFLTEEELLDVLTAVNLYTLATPFWIYTPEQDVPDSKDRDDWFPLLLMLGLFSDVVTDERGSGLGRFVGGTRPPPGGGGGGGPGFPPPGGGTPGGGANSPDFNLPNPFPPPNSPNTPLNNPFGPVPEPAPVILIIIGLGAGAGYGYRRCRRDGGATS